MTQMMFIKIYLCDITRTTLNEIDPRKNDGDFAGVYVRTC